MNGSVKGRAPGRGMTPCTFATMRDWAGNREADDRL